MLGNEGTQMASVNCHSHSQPGTMLWKHITNTGVAYLYIFLELHIFKIGIKHATDMQIPGPLCRPTESKFLGPGPGICSSNNLLD